MVCVVQSVYRFRSVGFIVIKAVISIKLELKDAILPRILNYYINEKEKRKGNRIKLLLKLLPLYCTHSRQQFSISCFLSFQLLIFFILKFTPIRYLHIFFRSSLSISFFPVTSLSFQMIPNIVRYLNRYKSSNRFSFHHPSIQC